VLVDIAVRRSKAGVKVLLVSEMLNCDLATLAQRRKADSQLFSEAELLTVLSHVTAGLLQAKSKTSPTGVFERNACS
jgi:hypothetical protein